MRPAALLLCVLALPLGTACRGGGANPSAPTGGAASADAIARAAATATPMRFRRMRAMLDQGVALAARGNAASLRAMSPRLSHEGLALIQATLPHDVARTDVPRYLEGRARFGDALKQWVTVVESGTDAQVLAAIRRLDDATRGWIDAYLGREPETSV